jgi:hypothetical protein
MRNTGNLSHEMDENNLSIDTFIMKKDEEEKRKRKTMTAIRAFNLWTNH